MPTAHISDAAPRKDGRRAAEKDALVSEARRCFDTIGRCGIVKGREGEGEREGEREREREREGGRRGAGGAARMAQ